MNTNLNKKASFLMGLALGVIFMLVVSIGVTAGVNTYNRRVRWRGLDPNTKIMEIYTLLNRFSIMPFDLDVMLESMYRGLLDGVGDPYTQYFDHAALAAFRTRTEGAYVGIGVMVFIDPEDRAVTVSTAFQGAPAALAGLLPGDKIIGVEGVDVVGRPLEEVVGMIAGPENTPIGLTIFRPYENERFDVQIVRGRVEIPTVFHDMIPTLAGNIGYLRIEGFDRVTRGQFREALDELEDLGMSGLILDLRNNPGGLLDVVNYITDTLIPEGVITFTEDAGGHRNYHYSGEEYLGLPLVVLINERSASASELLSGAVRDAQMGTLVGTRTFGKGIVQNLLYLSDGTAIKLTVQKYFTPNGESIHNTGIEPHITVEMAESLSRRIGHIDREEDVQLQAALEIIEAKVIRTFQNPSR